MTVVDARRARPFVPALATELAQRPGIQHGAFEGSILSMDISGFTALSEKLAEKGKVGAEELGELMNGCLDALIRTASDRGGEVLKFGGDALYIAFRGPAHHARAARAALELHATLKERAREAKVDLSMTVGAHAATFDAYLVGSRHRELILTGPGTSTVIDLESAAEPGQTLVSDDLASRLDGAKTSSAAVGVELLDTPDLDPALPPLPAGGVDLSTLYPATLLQQLDALEGLGGEHRTVTIGFVAISGVANARADGGPAALSADLSAIVDTVLESCERHHVSMLQSDVGVDVVKLLLTAGAPISTGADADAMLLVALDAIEAPTRLDIRVGVDHGRVFAATQGNEVARTYTVIGSAVNRAARLLGVARPGDVIASSEVTAHTTAPFAMTELAPVSIRGVEHPLPVSRIDGLSTRVGETHDVSQRLIGREDEVREISETLAGGGVVQIVGPGGIGKTRLLAELLAAPEADASGPVVTFAACKQYESSTPFAVLRALFRPVFGIDRDMGADRAGVVLAGAVPDEAAHHRPLLPLLAEVLGADVPPTREAHDIDPELRRARVADMLVDVMAAMDERRRLIAVDDLQWVDSASGDVLDAVSVRAAARGWAIVATSREDLSERLAGEGRVTIRLRGLPESDVRALAIEAAPAPLDDHSIEAIVDRASGNPLFVRESARALATGSAEVPEDLESLMNARLDRLAPSDRRLVRMASVFGREVPIADLEAIVGAEAPGLEATRLSRLVEVIDAGRAGTVTFRHALLRDAAYEGLPYRRRRRLHGLVAEHLEFRAYRSSAAELSLHCSAAGQHEKAWRHSVVAGRRALDLGANVEAAEAFQRALDAANRAAVATDDERAEIAVARGDASLAAGRFDDAFSAYQHARRFWDRGHRLVDVMRRQGIVRERQGDVTGAVRWYERCLRLLEAEDESTAVSRVSCEVALAYSAARHRQGRFDECLRWAERARHEADALDDTNLLAKAFDRLHVAATYVGDPRADLFGPRALELHEVNGDHRAQARTLDNLGIQAYFAESWSDALDLYRRAAEAGARAGDVIETGLGRANAAEILNEQGFWEDAEATFVDVIRTWGAAGWTFGVWSARSNLALARARIGTDRTSCGRRLEDARAAFADLGADEFVDETTLRLAEVAVLLGDGDRAASVLAGLDTDDARLHRRRLRLAGLAAWCRGETDEATAHLAGSLAAADETGSRLGAGLASMLLARLTGESTLSNRAASLLASMGVHAWSRAWPCQTRKKNSSSLTTIR